MHASRTMKRGPRRPWRACLYMYGRHVSLGNYATKDEAKKVEDIERKRYKKERLEKR